MKNIVKYVLLFTVIIITVKCDEQVSSYNKEIYSITGVVYDQMIDDTSPNPMVGIKVYLDNDSTFTGGNGNFVFYKEKGEHNIRINLPDYEPYSEIISVSKDTEINIILYHFRENYCPIYENSQLKFKYIRSGQSSMGGYYRTNTAIWDIYKSEIIGDNKVYYVKQTMDDNSIIYFTIIESLKEKMLDKKITIKGLPYFSDITFNPYIDPRRPEVVTLTVNGTSHTITLKKNIGIYKIEYCHNCRENIVYERIE